MNLQLMKASCKLSVVQWEEKHYDIISDTKKLTRVATIFNVTGDLQGKASVEYLMAYTNFDKDNVHNSSAVYTGLMKVEGLLNGKRGSFIIEDRGIYEDGGCKSTLTIVSGSGTEDFKNISGHGHLVANHIECSFQLDYSF